MSNNVSIENLSSPRRRTQRVYHPLLISVIQPWFNGSPPPYSDTVATQFAFGSDPTTYIDHDNGQFIPENFSISAAATEPSTSAMIILGFAGIGFIAYRRRSKTAMLNLA